MRGSFSAGGLSSGNDAATAQAGRDLMRVADDLATLDFDDFDDEEDGKGAEDDGGEEGGGHGGEAAHAAEPPSSTAQAAAAEWTAEFDDSDFDGTS